MEFTIAPHFLETWWFKILAGLFVLFLVRLFYMIKMRSINAHRRELEHQVAERTQNLKNKTVELENKGATLEKVNNIVKSINVRVNPKDILAAILEETAIQEGIKRAGALVYDKALHIYTFKAALGYDADEETSFQFSYQEAEDRYIEDSEELFKDIFLIKNVKGRSGEEKVKRFGIPRSMLLLKIRIEDEAGAAGYLIFEDMEDEDAFEKRDIELIKELKDHIASAFIKSKLLMELELEREAAEAANYSKSMFLARMSHEIRTPMNSVIGFADMLLDTPLNDIQVEFTRNIGKSGEALLYLIDEILDFSKIEAGQLSFQGIDFDLEVMAFDICRLIQPRLGNKPIEILCRIGDNIPAYVSSDARRIRQVLANLMGNAAKFTEAGEIELSLNIEDESRQRLKLHAAVRDTGIGISSEQLDYIFELFQQADGSVTRKYDGTGLGLAISRQIAVLMGGNVWVESKEGEGSTFHFTAWLTKSEKKPAQRPSFKELKGKKILLAEDNPNNMEILSDIVLRAGMRVVKVKQCAGILPGLIEAQKAGEPFDLCVLGLDLRKQELSPCDAVERIRANPDPPISDLPLLGFSSSGEKRVETYRQAGLDGFLSMPVRGSKLLAMMQRLLGPKSDAAAEEGSRDGIKRESVVTRHSLAEEAKHSIHILLAEDNPMNRKLARFMLTKGGYGLDVANNGKEAVEMYEASPGKFDLIFMDIQMPEMDGREATRRIRELEARQPTTNRIPIVAITAHALKEDRGKCLEAGMDDYITKPIKRDIVFNIINKWVLKKDN